MNGLEKIMELNESMAGVIQYWNSRIQEYHSRKELIQVGHVIHPSKKEIIPYFSHHILPEGSPSGKHLCFSLTQFFVSRNGHYELSIVGENASDSFV